MVFHSTQRMRKMASSTTAKSQPLHNFSLPDLKWAMNQSNTNRFRKLSDSSHKSPSPQNHADDSDADKCRRQDQNQSPAVLVEAVKTEKSVVNKKSSTTDDVADNSEKKPVSASSDGSRSKIFIRIRAKNSKLADEVADTGDHSSAAAEDAEESGPKTWNLRPRKLVTKANHNSNNNNVTGGAPKIGAAATQEMKVQAKVSDKKEKGKENEKEKKQKFSISLSKEEIEDDFFTMTGSKPSRRPKKRARNVQKQLDYAFPGLWLASITPDEYRVNDGTTKG